MTKNKIREIPESEKKTNSTLSIKNKNVEKPESERITNSTLLTEDKDEKKTEPVEIPQHSNPIACGSNWTIGTSMHWTKIRVSKTWYKNGQKKLRRAIGFWEA